MKATLEFNLNDPDDVKAHLRAVKSLTMALVLWEIEFNFKRKLESHVELWADACTPEMVITEFFKQFDALMQENDIRIDELVD